MFSNNKLTMTVPVQFVNFSGSGLVLFAPCVAKRSSATTEHIGRGATWRQVLFFPNWEGKCIIRPEKALTLTVNEKQRNDDPRNR